MIRDLPSPPSPRGSQTRPPELLNTIQPMALKPIGPGQPKVLGAFQPIIAACQQFPIERLSG
ncbi:MAG: hypothetical protein OXC80_00110 [Gammaproteobacteria bacterium]|nr:hypothetical protein [Gammaproteobacteria bacterium]